MSYDMLGVMLFALFLLFLATGVPLAVALGLSGTAVVAFADLGMLSVPMNVYNSISKYPLLAIPMFILAGVLFERAGIAASMVRFAASIVGPRRGGLAATAIIVAMILGGISGSGPAASSAVGAVMIPQMVRAAYPRGFAAAVVGAGASTDILIPPSIALVIYSMLMPEASVPALFAAGMVPGVLAGLCLIGGSVWLARHHEIGTEREDVRPPFWASLREAIWALMAPVVILGSMRTGLVTPTEAAVLAVFYGLVVGVLVYRTLTPRVLYRVLVEACELSAIILIILALASVFSLASNALGTFDHMARALVASVSSEVGLLLMINLVLLIAGMFIDGISIFFIFLPLFIPIMNYFQWDPVWFGILITINIAIGQFTPPVGLNLVVTARIARTSLESTTYWAVMLSLFMVLLLLLCTFVPQVVLWLPRALGY
ncbi:tripartite ATP-independent transporter DctM subunit [Kerstersia gyiorum]|nr:tripartite ATP-independent transporter DctM subunit [Kerstersia gyiorum]MCP1824001.1 tripartite ATP-independent transporter DctM subunit [Kerstersia gyiorum]MCP1827442.1 tripartite ATP-independent transporter DctM subunit [Kerstersia gyiorum]MCW2448909.1 tripartite ATP-independent transporter DctM subunit [Kerstersia gyiorum]